MLSALATGAKPTEVKFQVPWHGRCAAALKVSARGTVTSHHRSPWVLHSSVVAQEKSKLSPHSEFQTSQGYMVRPCLKDTTQQNKNTSKNPNPTKLSGKWTFLVFCLPVAPHLSL